MSENNNENNPIRYDTYDAYLSYDTTIFTTGHTKSIIVWSLPYSMIVKDIEHNNVRLAEDKQQYITPYTKLYQCKNML